MLFLILKANISNESPNTIDVVGKNDAADRLNEDHKACFLIASGNDISESYSQHDGCAPVIRPNVLLVPGRVHYSLIQQPIWVLVHVRHA